MLAVILSFTLVFSFTACGEESGKGPIDGNNPSGGGSEDPYCIGIEIKSEPQKLTYNAGEVFNPSGLVFDATFMIDGKEELITNMTYTDCTYTHKGEALTADVTKIEFDCFTYKFSVAINVIAVDYTAIELSLNGLPSDVFTGETIDLTQLQVKALTADGETVLSADSYTLTDNGKEIAASQYYEMTKGAHKFEAKFLDLTDSVTVTAWDEADMTLTAAGTMRQAYIMTPTAAGTTCTADIMRRTGTIIRPRGATDRRATGRFKRMQRIPGSHGITRRDGSVLIRRIRQCKGNSRVSKRQYSSSCCLSASPFV